MNLEEYFEDAKGRGILATSDSDGNTNAALYSRPYIIDEDTVAFSMLERRSYSYIQSNPRAAFLWVENSPGHNGVRLYLEVTGEELDPEKVKQIKSTRKSHRAPRDVPKHLIYFKVTQTRSLIGDKQL